MLLAIAAGAASLSCAGRATVRARISVDTTRQYQRMEAWEVTSQAGQSWAGYGEFRDTMMALAADLGINRLRLEVRSGAEHRGRDYWAENKAGRLTGNAFRCGRYETLNDNDDPRHTDMSAFRFTELDESVEGLVIPLRRAVEARGGRLAINVNYVSFITQCPPGWRYDHRAPEEYAEFVVAVVRHLKTRYDIVPEYWEVILEPENTADWNGTLIGQAIVAAAARLAEAGFGGIRFIAPSTTSMAEAPAMWDAMLRVPGVRPHVAELSYHRYRGVSLDAMRAIALRSRRDSVPTAMLEKIGADVDHLIGDLTVAQASSWQQFAMGHALPESDFRSRDGGGLYFLVNEADRRQIRPGVRTPGLRQVMHYVRRGAYRLEASSNDAENAPAIAFRNEDGGHVVVVRVKAPRGGDIEIAGLPAGRYGITFVTGDTVTGAHADVTLAGSAPLATTIPGAGVLTVFAR